MNFLQLKHDPYGHNKRLDFFVSILGSKMPSMVLDIGCGTGELLTFPLAFKFPNIQFYGVDSDFQSIEIAKGNNCPQNLKFFTSLDDVIDLGFDIVLASEVIEHVENPFDFLLTLRSKLNNNGLILLTVPNGFGPFEFGTLIENLLYISGFTKFINLLKRKNSSKESIDKKDTVANSPHVNFFTFNEIKSLFFEAGLSVNKFKPRTFICGPFFDKIVTYFNLTNWNSVISERISPSLCSDWMFEIGIKGEPIMSNWARGYWASWRRKFNLKRAGLLLK